MAHLEASLAKSHPASHLGSPASRHGTKPPLSSGSGGGCPQPAFGDEADERVEPLVSHGGEPTIHQQAVPTCLALEVVGRMNTIPKAAQSAAAAIGRLPGASALPPFHGPTRARRSGSLAG